jgi:phosphate acetyltransferase
MDEIENRTFDEIQVGDSSTLERTLTPDDIKVFAVMSGDVNPAHVDEEYAQSDMFHKIIAHGMWGGALISTLLGTKLPGPGAIYLGQTLKFLKPVAIGDLITVKVTVAGKDPEKHRIELNCCCTNQNGDMVISGSAQVMAPTEKIKRQRVELPEVHLHDHGTRFRQLIGLTKGLSPLRMAIVHPVDGNSLRGTVNAAKAGLIIPVFIGPEAKIRAAAAAENIELCSCELVPTHHSQEAAATAVALARVGKVEGIMKGSLHTDELMHEVVARQTGLCTGRRISHVFAMDVPEYPRPLFLTDAAINVYPE